VGNVIVSLISLWFGWGCMYAFYCYAKKTDASMAPIERKIWALIYGLAWPYDLYKYFTGKRERAALKRDREETRERILNQ
jgi:hypothetical protein